jgi:carbon monoxide dehydrogenase subunit G
MTGEQRIPLPQTETWNALYDPEIMKDAIPGCESFERLSDTQYQMTMLTRIGPVNARFKGLMTLSNIDAPSACTMTFEGQGGVAGFAKGEAQIKLVPEGDSETSLAYAVKATIGGKIAQLGARLVDGVARKLADQFFTAFRKRVSPPEADKPSEENEKC